MVVFNVVDHAGETAVNVPLCTIVRRKSHASCIFDDNQQYYCTAGLVYNDRQKLVPTIASAPSYNISLRISMAVLGVVEDEIAGGVGEGLRYGVDRAEASVDCVVTVRHLSCLGICSFLYISTIGCMMLH